MPTFAGADGSVDLFYFCQPVAQRYRHTFENSLLITRYYQITNDGLVLWTRPVDATTALGQGDNRPGMIG